MADKRGRYIVEGTPRHEYIYDTESNKTLTTEDALAIILNRVEHSSNKDGCSCGYGYGECCGDVSDKDIALSKLTVDDHIKALKEAGWKELRGSDGLSEAVNQLFGSSRILVL